MISNVNHGIIGTMSPLIGVAVSFIPSLEEWMRITSLGVGIVVGLATIVCMIRNSFFKK